jgi:hypothetical protein
MFILQAQLLEVGDIVVYEGNMAKVVSIVRGNGWLDISLDDGGRKPVTDRFKPFDIFEKVEHLDRSTRLPIFLIEVPKGE